jgi:hypothetical protein
LTRDPRSRTWPGGFRAQNNRDMILRLGLPLCRYYAAAGWQLESESLVLQPVGTPGVGVLVSLQVCRPQGRPGPASESLRLALTRPLSFRVKLCQCLSSDSQSGPAAQAGRAGPMIASAARLAAAISIIGGPAPVPTARCYTIYCSIHTTVYVSCIYHGIYALLCHGIYHIISSSFISHSIHVSSTPPGPCAPVQRSSRRQFRRTALLRDSVKRSLCLCTASSSATVTLRGCPRPWHSTTSRGSAHRACFCCLSPRWNLHCFAVAPARLPMRWGKVRLLPIQQGISGTRPSTFSALQIHRLPAGRLVLLAESKNIGTLVHCMTELGVSLLGSKVLKKT